ncbi:MAG: hypothetical protein GWP41_03440 [Planctomycetia bacterium]|nr:hypothetical protein [Planctomycetia bacterium]NCG13955.1 hypothetical protein [Planctomycetia bacterium]NCG56337.1 hypothetical protein [Pseudomonadota bacterium]
MNSSNESTRTRLLRIQKELAENSRQEISWNSGSIKDIESVYQKSTHQPFEPAEFTELVQAALESRIIFIGDYHTLRESQKTPLRLANRLLTKNKELVFCTEAFHIDDQPHLQRWLEDEIDDNALLKETDWKSKWGFPWRNFGMQLQYFKDRSIPIVALNSHEKIVGDSFAARDRIAAMRLVEILKEHPNAILIVSFGDLHMAPDHLPSEVSNVLASLGHQAVQQTILFQNVDEIYWELAQQELEQTVSLVRLEDGNFCFLGTTPLVKVQSALNWYSNELELEESLGLEQPPTISSSVMNDQIWLIIETLCEFLEIAPEGFQDFSVYTSRNLGLLDDLTGTRKLTEAEINRIQEQYEREESCYLPRPRIIFLGNLSMRHAAEEASHHINFVLCKDTSSPKSPIENFYETTIRECLGYLGTKIVDHNRRPLGLKEIDRILEDLEEGYSHPFHDETRESLLATRRFLKLLSSEKVPSAMDFLPSETNAEIISGSAHLIGYLLGDGIYNGLMEGRISRSEVCQLFSESLAKPNSGSQLFEAWILRAKPQA